MLSVDKYLEGQSLGAGDRTSDGGAHVRPVRMGGVYELRAALQAGEGDERLRLTPVPLEFRDADGALVDPRLICDQVLIPGLDPLELETLPPIELSDGVMAGALASRFFIAPPDAVEVRIGPVPNGIAILRLEVEPLNVNWASAAVAGSFIKKIEDVSLRRIALLKAALPGLNERDPAARALTVTPRRQLESIARRFEPRGDWRGVLNPEDLDAAVADHQRRMERLRSQTEHLPKVGFIGSDRGYERLEGMAELYRLRQTKAAEQLRLLDLDLIVIEAGAGCGDDDDRDWPLAFSALDGRLPDAGAALFDLAEAHGTPVHLWLTGAPGIAVCWRGAAERAARVVLEGRAEEWAGVWDDLQEKIHRVRRATCPTACSVGSLRKRERDRMLVPAVADIFQYPDFAALIVADSVAAMLLMELRYAFNAASLGLRIRREDRQSVGAHTRAQERLILQSANLVLLPAQSLRSDSELLVAALDAIASGAVPVLYGDPRSDEPLLGALDRVRNVIDLIELQALYRTPWVLERRWRGLMRKVVESHVWKMPDRMAIFGRDPFPEGFDEPRVSSILITRRPQLLAHCFESFRKQSWPNKELILVLNTGEVPDELPEPRENEHVFVLPESANIGECLNRAIAQSTGRYWAKMDDDDFYSRTYLEETISYYVATQADSVGRQSTFFFFSATNETQGRLRLTQNYNRVLQFGHVSGASLSGDKMWLSLPFSAADRNSADSNWVAKLLNAGVTVMSGDTTSIVVFRSENESQHTWHMTVDPNVMKQFRIYSAGSIAQRLDAQL
ncbi:glycosyltransferase family 2 protein [Pikeienuella piscinae]|uniref:Glycosyltransferase family 2 protein n=1 Tax=Pikeienuella piscinae TaxID=2748098 RepID=A0A7L5C1B1_9RHOB|nr:glycosyltransferase family A protein [Pikeienuella piscinae]QIE55639.1 glycosyltransferase family 2 protein [Pikeienuella piscinae]